MGKILDLHGNEINSETVEEENETVDEVEPSGSEDIVDKEPSPTDILYLELQSVIRESVEATIKRAELQNVKMSQQIYLEIMQNINAICLHRVMRFLNEDIGIDSMDMIFTDEVKNSIKSAIQFERKLEPTQEEIDNINKNNK